MAPKSGTTDSLARYLTSGYYYDEGEDPRHWDTSPSNVITVNLARLTNEGQALARAALDAWEMVADIRFQETTNGADITFDDKDAGADADVSYYPSTSELISAEVNVGTDWLAKHGTAVGGYAFQTYMHEIGHALGLGHSGDYGGTASYANATWTNDSWQQSVMSYLDQDENPNLRAEKAYVVTPMMADIVAVQSIYGAPASGPTHRDTVWGAGSNLPDHLGRFFGSGPGDLERNAMTIYDAGGTDLLNLSDDRSAQVINLAPGSFSSAYGQIDNIGIARNTTIERVFGGSGGDKITGNGAVNVLKGNGGNDRAYGDDGADSVYGGAGADSLFGGDGGDRVFGGDGHDRAWGEQANDRMEGGDGNDGLYAGFGDDVLVGGAGADQLAGGPGRDKLTGGGGADSFIYLEGADVVADFRNNSDTLLFDDALWGGGARTPSQILARARVVDGDVLFNFGDGNTLRLEGVTNAALLLNDLGMA